MSFELSIGKAEEQENTEVNRTKIKQKRKQKGEKVLCPTRMKQAWG